MARKVTCNAILSAVLAGATFSSLPAIADRNFSYDYVQIQAVIDRYSNGPDLWGVRGEISSNIWEGVYLRGQAGYAEGDDGPFDFDRSHFTGMVGYATEMAREIDFYGEIGFTYQDYGITCNAMVPAHCDFGESDTSFNAGAGIRGWASDNMELKAGVARVGGINTYTEVQLGLAAWLDYRSALTMDFAWHDDHNALLFGYRYTF